MLRRDRIVLWQDRIVRSIYCSVRPPDAFVRPSERVVPWQDRIVRWIYGFVRSPEPFVRPIYRFVRSIYPFVHPSDGFVHPLDCFMLWRERIVRSIYRTVHPQDGIMRPPGPVVWLSEGPQTRPRRVESDADPCARAEERRGGEKHLHRSFTTETGAEEWSRNLRILRTGMRPNPYWHVREGFGGRRCRVGAGAGTPAGVRERVAG